MKKGKQIALYIAWLCLYLLCLPLGTVAGAQGIEKTMLVLAALAFFVPGFWLAAVYLKKEDRKGLRALRIISAASLGLTVLALAANFLSVQGSQDLGTAVYHILSLVSVPMLCAQYWVLSLFLWACLLMLTVPGVVMPRKKK